MQKNIPPFHLAIPVSCLEKSREFYTGLLGCSEGRSSDKWVDFNFYGHQFVVHLGSPMTDPDCNEVDGHAVPSFHFGLILDWGEWQKVADKLIAAGTNFVIEPYVRFEGEVGEQATMFFLDPSGNAIELKSFRDMSQIFAN